MTEKLYRIKPAPWERFPTGLVSRELGLTMGFEAGHHIEAIWQSG
jgi:hypothetical protein